MNDWTLYFGEELASAYTWEFDSLQRDTRSGSSNALLSFRHLEHLKSINLDFFCWYFMRYADSIHY